MKPIQTAEDIIPLAEFKARTSQLFRKLRDDQRPLIITQNGKPAAVLITPQDFDRILERDRFEKAVAAGFADAEAGRLTNDPDLTDELDKELGPLKRD